MEELPLAPTTCIAGALGVVCVVAAPAAEITKPSPAWKSDIPVVVTAEVPFVLTVMVAGGAPNVLPPKALMSMPSGFGPLLVIPFTLAAEARITRLIPGVAPAGR